MTEKTALELGGFFCWSDPIERRSRVLTRLFSCFFVISSVISRTQFFKIYHDL